ncbi:MAG: hypothetical protein E6Q41_03605 [Cyclobacteriaceae bacterium]|nr:MAG: hypothetical protein E6Q41_03605 [Cyclobacteriaceae bacterium]
MQIEPLVPVWIIATAGIALMMLFGWLEWKRNTKFLPARLTAAMVMVLSVLLYLLQPAVQRERTTSGVMVLTQNYQIAQADSVRAKHPDFRFLVMPGAAPYSNGQQLISASEVLNYKDEIRIIAGDGLPAWALPKSGFRFLGGIKQAGIVNLNIPDKIYANRKTTLTGLWNGAATTLMLEGPGGTLDSIRLVAGTNPFALSFTPQQTGKFLFSLKASATKLEEVLPLEVLPMRSLQILMFQSYPSAETRYMKNFLIEQGHGVAIRTQISKTSYRTEFGNLTSINLNRITSELLKEFDLVILANETALTKNDQMVLEKATRSGLGLLWLCSAEELQNPMFGFKVSLVAADTAHLQVEEKEIVLPAVPANINPDITVHANARRTLSGYNFSGVGKIGVQLLQETYTQQATAEAEIYSALWTPLLEALARPVSRATKVIVKNDFPIYLHEPIEIEVISSQAMPELVIDSIALPLREDLVIDNYWSTSFWATQPGWHTVTATVDSVSTNFYVHKHSAWQGVKSSVLQTRNRANQSADNTKQETFVVEQKRISPLWFFILFLLSAGFLWLAPKL